MEKDIDEVLDMPFDLLWACDSHGKFDLLWACDSHGKGQIFKYLDAWLHTWATTYRKTKEKVAGQHYRKL